jgi:penicillin-binding protein 1A
MISMLRDVVSAGTAAHVLRGGLVGITTAGKTGTTDENRDKWFCGFTPYYTAAVWYGYDNRLGLTTIPSNGDRDNAIRIWQDAMTRIHAGMANADFVKPSGVLTMTICQDSGKLAAPFCPRTAQEFFVPGAMMNPTELCNLPGHAVLPTPTPAPVVTETTAAPG